MRTIHPDDDVCDRCGQPLDPRLHVGGICGSCADDLRDDMPDDIEAYRNETSGGDAMNIRDAANICAPMGYRQLGYQECEMCHRIARDVAFRPVIKAQAGAGIVQMLQCEDVAECWLRAEEQRTVKA